MKEKVQLILDKYLEKFPNEAEKLSLLKKYINQSTDEQITDWNNQNGHLTASAFVYCQNEDKFLVLYHRDLKLYLCPGGHVEIKDKSPLETAKRELKEETGLANLEILKICRNGIPFDIDIHLVPTNERVNMPEHYHFDFRYLFFINELKNIVLDEEECKDYKWVSFDKLNEDKNYGKIINKLNEILCKKVK